jgi:hypothetical protein
MQFSVDERQKIFSGVDPHAPWPSEAASPVLWDLPWADLLKALCYYQRSPGIKAHETADPSAAPVTYVGAVSSF